LEKWVIVILHAEEMLRESDGWRKMFLLNHPTLTQGLLSCTRTNWSS
jgi:hypothetical protein